MDESFDISLVNGVLGELSEGSHNSLVLGDLVELDGVLSQSAGDLGDLDEGVTGLEG